MVKKTNYLKRNSISIILTSLFIATLILIRFLTFDVFADPDVFYHLKLSKMLFESGVVHDFPWHYYTISQYYFMDYHFLFHVILGVLIQLLGDVIGLNVYLILQALGLVFVILFVAKKFALERASLIVYFCLASSSSLLFAMNIGRAYLLSVMICLLLIFSLLKRKYFLTLILCIIFVLTYNAFPIAIILYIVAMVLNWVYERNFDLKLFISVMVGLSIGVIIHPNFPQNLLFYWSHIIGVALFPPNIPKGSEWSPYSFFDLIQLNFGVLLLYVISVWVFFKSKRYKHKKHTFFLLVSLLFLFSTFRSIVYVRYWIPTAILFVAFSLDQYLQIISWGGIKKAFRKYWQFRIASIVIIIAFASVSLFSIRNTIVNLKNGQEYTEYKEAANWLAENSEESDLVFNTRWDEFPQLFYWNSKNYYIMGMDPTYTYNFDKALYFQWEKIDKNEFENAEDLYHIMRNSFHSKFVFVDKDHSNKVYETLINDGSQKYFLPGFDDNNIAIFKIK